MQNHEVWVTWPSLVPDPSGQGSRGLPALKERKAKRKKRGPVLKLVEKSFCDVLLRTAYARTMSCMIGPRHNSLYQVVKNKTRRVKRCWAFINESCIVSYFSAFRCNCSVTDKMAGPYYLEFSKLHILCFVFFISLLLACA